MCHTITATEFPPPGPFLPISSSRSCRKAPSPKALYRRHSPSIDETTSLIALRVTLDSGMRDAAFQWIAQHGYAGIFSLLVFGIVGLPVPDEWLLTFSGYLVYKRTLLFLPTFGAAFLGSACGITVSYLLGRVL